MTCHVTWSCFHQQWTWTLHDRLDLDLFKITWLRICSDLKLDLDLSSEDLTDALTLSLKTLLVIMRVLDCYNPLTFQNKSFNKMLCLSDSMPLSFFPLPVWTAAVPSDHLQVVFKMFLFHPKSSRRVEFPAAAQTSNRCFIKLLSAQVCSHTHTNKQPSGCSLWSLCYQSEKQSASSLCSHFTFSPDWQKTDKHTKNHHHQQKHVSKCWCSAADGGIAECPWMHQ